MSKGMSTYGDTIQPDQLGSSNINNYGGAFGQQQLQQRQQGQQLGQGVESVVGKLGPWGMAAAAVSKVAGKAFAGDEYGNRSAGKRLGAGMMDMKYGMQNISALVKKPSFRNLGAIATGGLVKGDVAKDAAKLKKHVEMRKEDEKFSQNFTANNLASASNRGYVAPAYGAAGIKFPAKKLRTPKTKFAK